MCWELHFTHDRPPGKDSKLQHFSNHFLLPKLNTSNKQIPASGHKMELKLKIKAQSLPRWWLVINTPGEFFLLFQFLHQHQSSVLAQAGSSHSFLTIFLTLPSPSLGIWDVSSYKRQWSEKTDVCSEVSWVANKADASYPHNVLRFVLNKNNFMSEKSLLYFTCPIFLPRGGSCIKL